MRLERKTVKPAASLTQQSYVAVLKAKQAELLAIKTTSPTSFIPLLEIPDSPRVASIARVWTRPNEVLWAHPFNPVRIDDTNWYVEVRAIFDALRASNCAAVPVVTTNEPPSVLAAARTATEKDGRGLVVRLDCEDALEAGAVGLSADLRQTRENCGVETKDCDLVVDAGLVEGGPAVQASVVVSALNNLPDLADWRSVVVAFSAFPETVSSVVAKETVGSITRVDALAFTHLSSTWSDRELTFADYGVGVPAYADMPFTPIPSIRYTLQGEWMVHRGKEKRNPSPQYIALAKDLVAQPYFAGPDFSPGDDYIAAVANGAAGPGNAASYLRAAMSRHFHVVLDSLATRGAP